MPRAIWKGAISFGLVYVPIEVFPATQSERTGFNLLDKRSLDPVGYQQINKRTGKTIKRDDIVRGYEYEKGAYVVMSEEEIDAASPEQTQTVDILGFVEAAQVSFLYLDTPYWLAPDKRAGKTYALLRDALAASGKIGIANVVLHSRQHLAALVAAGPVLALQTLRWSTEVRDVDEIPGLPKTAKSSGVSAGELNMAKKLIEDMSTEWDPDAYRDTYRDAIMELAERKVREGKAHEIGPVEHVKTERRSADIVDLSELLKRSLGQRKGGAREETARAKPASKRGKKAA